MRTQSLSNRVKLAFIAIVLVVSACLTITCHGYANVSCQSTAQQYSLTSVALPTVHYALPHAHMPVINNHIGITGRAINGLSDSLDSGYKGRTLLSPNSYRGMGRLGVIPTNVTLSTSAQSAILMESGSNRVLYSKNAHQKLPMASTTKIMTAYTVIKNSDLDQIVTIDSRAVGIEGSSIYLRAGEKLSVRELLYGLMLQSGNDSAVALALHVSGSIEDFAILMNKEAVALGATNSNFCNPHGLHDDSHYTTASDLGLITCAAIKLPEFSCIVSTKSIKIANGEQDNPRIINNKNKLLNIMDDANGVKTGYTKRAGRCFVGSANRDNMQLVAVVLNCGPMFEDAHRLLEYGFANYQLKALICKDKMCGVVFERGHPTYYMHEGAFNYPMLKNGSEDKLISRHITLPDKDVQGKIDLYLDKQLIYSSKLVKI
ncbi:MAG: D-alanyl-D-alanine carboxypeptidase [Clostridia bacterium]|nr:D-alanyl-D-alanine carboxypeptidase [Clostridia bacterium]